jgi:hypothetical protein
VPATRICAVLDPSDNSCVLAKAGHLPPGVTLALYTDGLVESRTRPLDDGTAAMCAALAAALAQRGSVLGSVCESVTKALCQPGEDDITLVLARIRQ